MAFTEKLLRNVFGFTDMRRVGSRTLDDRLQLPHLRRLQVEPEHQRDEEEAQDEAGEHQPGEHRAQLEHDGLDDHARETFDEVCWGVVSAAGGEARAVFPLKNLAASPLRFEVGADLVPVMEEIDEAGHEMAAIYHSHTRTAPEPSQTDINFAANWPGVEWIIVGLTSHDSDADVRSFRIEDGRVQEVGLEVG